MADYTNNPNNFANNPNNNPNNRESNNTLYFIVGGLVVLAFIFGFIYMGNNDRIEREGIEPAAGTTSTIANPDVNTDNTPAMTEDRNLGQDGVTDSATPVNESESTPGMPTSTGEQAQ